MTRGRKDKGQEGRSILGAYARCRLCWRPYNHRASPTYALDQDLNVVGTVHRSCARQYCHRHELPQEFAQVSTQFSLDYARRVAWLRSRELSHRNQQSRRYEDNIYWAAQLFLRPNTAEQLLSHWVNDSGQLPFDRLEEVRSAWLALEKWYMEERRSDYVGRT